MNLNQYAATTSLFALQKNAKVLAYIFIYVPIIPNQWQ